MSYVFVTFCCSLIAMYKSNISCKRSEDPTKNELFLFLQRINLKQSDFYNLKNSADAIGIETYGLIKSKSLTIQIIKYDLSYPIIRNKFEWQKGFFYEILQNDVDSYSITCFTDKTDGYMIVITKPPLRTSAYSFRQISFIQFKNYLLNLVSLFKYYQKMNAVFMDIKYGTFRIDARNLIQPVITNLNSLSEENKLCYISVYEKNILKNFGSVARKIKSLKNDKIYLRTKATYKWHIFNLLTQILGDCYEYMNIHTGAEKNGQIVKILNLFVKSVERYYEDILSSNFNCFKWEVVDNLVSSLGTVIPIEISFTNKT